MYFARTYYYLLLVTVKLTIGKPFKSRNAFIKEFRLMLTEAPGGEVGD